MNEPDPNAASISLPSVQERNWAVTAHLSALAGFIIPGAGAILGPLLVWLLKKDEFAFVADQGREALNFQITAMILAAGCALLMLLLIGIPLLYALCIADLVFVVIAAIKASEGIAYRYPFNLRLIK